MDLTVGYNQEPALTCRRLLRLGSVRIMVSREKGLSLAPSRIVHIGERKKVDRGKLNDEGEQIVVVLGHSVAIIVLWGSEGADS